MKKISPILIILVILVGLLLHILLGFYLVEEWVFGDSSASLFEQVMYQLAIIPPFLIALFFYNESQKLGKSLGYSIFFYLISFTLVTLYHYVPHRTNYGSGNEIDIGSYGFYVTGGGIGPLAVIPHVLLTTIILFAIYKYYKK